LFLKYVFENHKISPPVLLIIEEREKDIGVGTLKAVAP
jgi:hypothetical protein